MSYTLNFINKLQAHSMNLNMPDPKYDTHQIHTAQYKSLTEQIIELMKTTPPKLLNRPWSMEELVTRLDGKYRDRPHPQDVGQALRVIGWNCKRYWGKGYNGVRVWLPPSDCKLT